MSARKLILFCQIALLSLLLCVSAEASAGYYIEYMHDPCVEYDSCYGPPRHVRHHRYHHARYNHRERAHSSASISVYYFWDIYPNYASGCCDTCTRCVERVERCAVSRCEDRYHSPDDRRHWRDSQYSNVYYDAERDYDTSTADDFGQAW